MEETLSMFLLVFLQLYTIDKQGTRSRAKHEHVPLTRIPLLHSLREVVDCFYNQTTKRAEYLQTKDWEKSLNLLKCK